MRFLALPILVLLAASALAQDGSDELIIALARGESVRLVGSAENGYVPVTTITPHSRLAAERVRLALGNARLDFSYLGVASPTAEQLAQSLASRIPVQVSTVLEPDTRRPTPEEQAFDRLPPEQRALLRDLPPAEALRVVAFARQNLIALGVAGASQSRITEEVRRVLSPYSAEVESASSGSTTFPPVSPLVSPYAPLR